MPRLLRFGHHAPHGPLMHALRTIKSGLPYLQVSSVTLRKYLQSSNSNVWRPPSKTPQILQMLRLAHRLQRNHCRSALYRKHTPQRVIEAAIQPECWTAPRTPRYSCADRHDIAASARVKAIAPDQGFAGDISRRMREQGGRSNFRRPRTRQGCAGSCAAPASPPWT